MSTPDATPEHLNELLQDTLNTALEFLGSLQERKVASVPVVKEALRLPGRGAGAREALDLFMQRFGEGVSSSAGPRYFGFVTGGVTPAALAADWLTSVFDQNVMSYGDSVAPLVELEAIGLLRDLFGLPDAFTGAFVTGATMSNVTGLAIARQWVGKQQGYNVAQNGLREPITILSGTPHSSVYKALAMLGLGRDSLQRVACLKNREAIDVHALESALVALDGAPCVVVANAGTVNSVDFDDFRAIAALKERFSFYLHVDGAFGGFASVSAKYRELVAGWETADSITVDAHKWLNVPYDSGVLFTRHTDLQVEVFQNAAAYLGAAADAPFFVHRTPENSRRFRALSAWMTLVAYGADGYKEMVERHVALAATLAGWLEASPGFRLLAPVSLNGICFTLDWPDGRPATLEDIQAFLAVLQQQGQVFLTPTVFLGTPAIRVSISNWRTQQSDIEQARKDMVKVFHEFIS